MILAGSSSSGPCLKTTQAKFSSWERIICSLFFTGGGCERQEHLEEDPAPILLNEGNFDVSLENVLTQKHSPVGLIRCAYAMAMKAEFWMRKKSRERLRYGGDSYQRG